MNNKLNKYVLCYFTGAIIGGATPFIFSLGGLILVEWFLFCCVFIFFLSKWLTDDE